MCLGERKHLTDKMFRDFWELRQTDYLWELRVRSLWQKLEENLAVGDVVLVVLPHLKLTFWPLGLVTAVSRRRWTGATSGRPDRN